MNTREDYLIHWLLTRDCLALRCLEKAAEIPTGTLNHVVRRKRPLLRRHWDKLEPVLRSYGWNGFPAKLAPDFTYFK